MQSLCQGLTVWLLFYADSIGVFFPFHTPGFALTYTDIYSIVSLTVETQAKGGMTEGQSNLNSTDTHLTYKIVYHSLWWK